MQSPTLATTSASKRNALKGLTSIQKTPNCFYNWFVGTCRKRDSSQRRHISIDQRQFNGNMKNSMERAEKGEIIGRKRYKPPQNTAILSHPKQESGKRQRQQKRRSQVLAYCSKAEIPWGPRALNAEIPPALLLTNTHHTRIRL